MTILLNAIEAFKLISITDVWGLVVGMAMLLASPILIFSYVPQVLSLYKNKSAEGISLSFWLILDTALLMLFILAVDGYMNTGSVGLMLAQAINLWLAVIVTSQVMVYKKKR